MWTGLKAMSHLGIFSEPLRFLGVSAAWWQLMTRLKVSGVGVSAAWWQLMTRLKVSGVGVSAAWWQLMTRLKVSGVGVSAAWWQLMTRLKVSGGVGPDMLVLLTHLASPHPVATESEVFTTSEMQTCAQPATKLTHSPLLPANPLC